MSPLQSVLQEANLKDEGAADILNCVAMSEDASSFACGTTCGLREYRLHPVQELVRLPSTEIVTCVAIDPKSRFLPLATSSKVSVWDRASATMLKELPTQSEILNLKLSADILAVICEFTVHLYACSDWRLKISISTCSNKSGLCAFSAKSSPWILACPGQKTGQLRIQFGDRSLKSHMIGAHTSPLAALSLSSCSRFVASASQYGTVIKVFGTERGQELHRLRRSWSTPAQICSLAFRGDGRMLAVASSTCTLHIFELPLHASNGLGGSTEKVLGSRFFDSKLTEAMLSVTGVARNLTDTTSSWHVKIPKVEKDQVIEVAFHGARPQFSVLQFTRSSGTLDEYGITRTGIQHLNSSTWFTSLASHQGQQI